MPTISLNALLHVARSGVLTQQTGIDILANNIANLNTIGYKKTRAEFSELLSEQLEAPPEGDARNMGQAAGVQLADNQRIFAQGMIEPSEKLWDLAIEGDGFFQVQMPDGSLAYTRDGRFQLDAEGRVVTPNGYYLSPNITMPPDAEADGSPAWAVENDPRVNPIGRFLRGSLSRFRGCGWHGWW